MNRQNKWSSKAFSMLLTTSLLAGLLLMAVLGEAPTAHTRSEPKTGEQHRTEPHAITSDLIRLAGID